MKTGGAHRPSIQSDAMEAIFGAIMTESGFDTAKAVILKLYEPVLSKLTPERMGKDAKTLLAGILAGSPFGSCPSTPWLISGEPRMIKRLIVSAK